jgi:hypothetical protein
VSTIILGHFWLNNKLGNKTEPKNWPTNHLSGKWYLRNAYIVRGNGRIDRKIISKLGMYYWSYKLTLSKISCFHVNIDGGDLSCCSVVFWLYANPLEEHTASIFNSAKILYSWTTDKTNVYRNVNIPTGHQPLLLFMLMGWGYVSVLWPPTGQVFIRQVNMSMDSHGGMILRENDQRIRRKTCPSATLSTINPTWTDSVTNPGLRSERPVSICLNHGMIITC